MIYLELVVLGCGLREQLRLLKAISVCSFLLQIEIKLYIIKDNSGVTWRKCSIVKKKIEMLSTLNLKSSAVDCENENGCTYSIQLPSVHFSCRLKFYSILFKEQFRCNGDKMHRSEKMIQNVSYLELVFGGRLQEREWLHLLLLTMSAFCSYLLQIEIHIIKKNVN